jgi:hypothetical protein
MEIVHDLRSSAFFIPAFLDASPAEPDKFSPGTNGRSAQDARRVTLFAVDFRVRCAIGCESVKGHSTCRAGVIAALRAALGGSGGGAVAPRKRRPPPAG